MAELAALHWLRPWWLLALAPLALVLWGITRRTSGRSTWHDVIDAPLIAPLLQRATRPQNRAAWIAAAAWLLTVIALAGPSWFPAPSPVSRHDDALVILLDLSLSMYAQDVAPSRLVRATRAIDEVLALRKEGRTALVAYAGDAHVVTPLTDDVRTIENLLPQLQPEIMPIPGSNIGDALDVARQLLRNANVEHGRLLAITDEIEHPADVGAGVPAGFALSVLGVGSAPGGPIPLAALGRRGEYLKDDQGDIVIARLDAGQLTRAAQLGGGTYRAADATLGSVATLLDTRGADRARAIKHHVFDTWSDQGYWLLLLVVPCAALAFRRGAVVSLALCCALATLPRPAAALTWQDLWQSRDQQGAAALRGGAPERAAQLFTSGAWRATALYRGKRYERAAALFAGQPGADGYYNRGTALARLGDIDGALAAYSKAIALQPRHADAVFNRDLLTRLRRERSQPSRQPQSGTQPRQGNTPAAAARAGQQQGTPVRGALADVPGADRSARAGDGARARPGALQPVPPQGERRAGARTMAARDADELQRATEQWLRRVPDNPGGLLQRKFSSESSARFLEHRAPTQSDKIW